jgi:prophage tail gpP-like protein
LDSGGDPRNGPGPAEVPSSRGMSAPKPRHKVTVICDHQQVSQWIEYEIESNMITPADGFTMRKPFDPESWRILRRDARVRVLIDDAPILDGFIDKRVKRAKEGTFEISGRDRSGRLVQESAPRINYEGLELTEAIKRLASPWFDKVVLSDAENRKLRMGKKGRRTSIGREPIIVKRTSGGNGRVQPGTMRWAIIEELVTQVGLICWSSADGKSLFVGKPNGSQAPSFHILRAKGGGRSSNCLDLIQDEDNGDRYSMIMVAGSGGGTDDDFGAPVASRSATVLDNDGGLYGVGRDFAFPKRLLLPEKHFDSIQRAEEAASREKLRRDFRRTVYSATMPYHGQWITPTGATLFAPNTVAMITDEEHDPVLEDNGLIYSCTYKRTRTEGETTTLELVPSDTEIVL